jgi:hypothetical protein
LTVSGIGAGGPRRFVGEVITNGCFRISAPKAENGFVAPADCFVERVGRNIGVKNSMISDWRTLKTEAKWGNFVPFSLVQWPSGTGSLADYSQHVSCDRHGWRSAIGKRPYPRHVAIGAAGQRRAGQDEKQRQQCS